MFAGASPMPCPEAAFDTADEEPAQRGRQRGDGHVRGKGQHDLDQQQGPDRAQRGSVPARRSGPVNPIETMGYGFSGHIAGLRQVEAGAAGTAGTILSGSRASHARHSCGRAVRIASVRSSTR